MKIEKSINPGWYNASCTINGQFYYGSWTTTVGALDRCFEKITWHLDLKR